MLIMASAKVIYNTLISKLNLPESAAEISAVAFTVLEYLGISRTDVIGNREVAVNETKLETVISRLNDHEPLQYIFNEAWFYGRKFFVDKRVLIPRPETELLIDIVKKYFSKADNFSGLDIGTGSGCIAITLALEFPQAKITAMDVSPDALIVARQNSGALNVSVSFGDGDILSEFDLGEEIDLVVSNPPYISHLEKSTLLPNVLNHEPHLALFASPDDPLIFYRAIAKKAKSILLKHGLLVTEIHENLGAEVVRIFEFQGFQDVSIHKDLFRKQRVVTAKRP